MRFRNWLEAVVATDRIGEQIKNTLELHVDGNWEFRGIQRILRRSETERSRSGVAGFLRNEKTPGMDRFMLLAEASFNQSKYDSISGELLSRDGMKLDKLSHHADGQKQKMEIMCRLTYARRGIENGVQISSIEYDLGARGWPGYPSAGSDPKAHYGGPLQTPMDVARWVKELVDGFKGFGDDDGDDESPELNPAPSEPVGV